MTIGIGGISRGGKSTLAALIFQLFTEGGQTATILAQDDYVFPNEQTPKIRQDKEVEMDWEIPESIDFQRYRNVILDAQQQFDNVITEGLLNFYAEDINVLFDKFLFVDISKATFLSRKAEDKRWGEVPNWYIEHIWESHLQFGRTIFKDDRYDVLVLSGEAEFDKNIVIDFLRK